MTFEAGYVLVLPVQFECGYIVIKIVDFPLAKSMTFPAVCRTIHIKLSVMCIGVTGGAFRRKFREHLAGDPVNAGLEMTCPAILRCMNPFKRETCNGMIKSDPGPLRGVVAYPAVRIGIILYFEMILVDIFMAILACNPDIPETPVLLFLMAGEAGCCQVGAIQFEGPEVVLLNGEGELVKPLGTVALRAISHGIRLRKLALVVVLMAVGAAVVFHRVGHVGFMAG